MFTACWNTAGANGSSVYDPDGHIIEVGENMEKVVLRFVNSGLSAGQTAERMDVPLGFVLSVLGDKTDASGSPR